MKRIVSTILMSAFLLSPASLLADNHKWNDSEQPYWHQWLQAQHKKDHDWNKASARERRDYWKWRDAHHDNDHHDDHH